MKSKKFVYGFGINDADYQITNYEIVDGEKKRTVCPFYSTWANMLKRCYCSKYHNSRSTYKNCSVSDE